MTSLEGECNIMVLREERRVSLPKLMDVNECTSSNLLDDQDDGFDEEESCLCEVCEIRFPERVVSRWNNMDVCWFCLDEMNSYFGRLNFRSFSS